MLILAWIISLIVVALLGYKTRELIDFTYGLKSMIVDKSAKTTVPEQKSFIIDPSDIAQQAKYERDQLMQKINP